MELGGEVFSHGREGHAAPQTQASTMIDIGGYYHFKRHPGEQFLFCYGHSLAGQTEQYAYIGMYWTGGKDKKKPDADQGWLFGALYLLACSGALVALYRFTTHSTSLETRPGQERFLRFYLLTMVVIAWAAVLIGAYVIYPWYRAVPSPGTADLSMFPQRLLMSRRISAVAVALLALSVILTFPPVADLF